jgi:hypothetical protein
LNGRTRKVGDVNVLEVAFAISPGEHAHVLHGSLVRGVTALLLSAAVRRCSRLHFDRRLLPGAGRPSCSKSASNPSSVFTTPQRVHVLIVGRGGFSRFTGRGGLERSYGRSAYCSPGCAFSKRMRALHGRQRRVPRRPPATPSACGNFACPALQDNRAIKIWNSRLGPE